MTAQTPPPATFAGSVRQPSRRAFLAGIPVAALALAACSSGSTSTSTSTASGSAAAPTTAAPATPGSVAALAQAFQATLSADQQATLVHTYTLANAELWSNLPQSLLSHGGGGASGGAPSGSLPSGGSMPTGSLPSGGPGSGSGPSGAAGPRLGISLTTLSDTQMAAFTALLKAATGTADGVGYAEILQHLNADDYLNTHGGGDEYGRANFYISFLGAPADTGTWEFQFGGHHLAVANTYKDGALIGATPSFRGIEPNGPFTENGTSNEPLKVKETALKALLAGLTTEQQATAKLSTVFADLVLGAGKDWAFPTAHEGLKVSTLTATQKTLVTDAIASYVNDIADSDAKTILAKYQSELNDTYVAYSGTTALTEFDDYIRIDGPSVWIEFSMQHGIVLTGNHPHSVWRDRNTDYGGTKS